MRTTVNMELNILRIQCSVSGLKDKLILCQNANTALTWKTSMYFQRFAKKYTLENVQSVVMTPS